MSTKLFTSESVTIGHPDKMCDQISDAILDAILNEDKHARVACETTVCTGMVLIMGEITTTANVDISAIVRSTILDIGYTRAKYGFDGNSCSVLISLNKQSPDIAQGVNSSQEYKASSDSYDQFGAGDQGMMFGYACNETPELMPAAIVYAHKLTQRLAEVRQQGILDYLRPDGKSQVTVEYDGDIVKRIDTVVVSAQHSPDISHEQIIKDITKYVIKEVLPANLLDNNTKYYINPTGKFVVGGPMGDSGLTGRKIIVDTYGGYCAHGGGCFSGKDSTKVDRCATYMARYICKNLVAANAASKLSLEISYAIGVARPISLSVDTYGTSCYTDEQIIAIINKVFDLRPKAIIDTLGLMSPIYKETARNGHFGKSRFSWEQLNKVDEIKAILRTYK